MKTVPIHDIATAGTSQEDIVARIDIENVAHIMNHLSNLYSDPIYAVVREYSTNALDSHVAAGNTAPIEIHLPSPDSLEFVVQDEGVGLDIEELREVYLNYGASTKRDSNDFNGTLGFGSKSGVTYAPLGWKVRAVKNGQQVLAVVAKNEDGIAVMRVLASGPSGLPNGVRITIPVDEDDVSDFADAARKLFGVWDQGTAHVLQAGQVVTDDFVGTLRSSSLIWLDDDVAIRRLHNGLATPSVIVMNNVPYPWNGKSSWDYGIVAFVDAASVHFVPSREGLHFTDHTNETLTELLAYVNDRAQAKVEQYIRQGSTPYEIAERYREAVKVVDGNWARRLRYALIDVLPVLSYTISKTPYYNEDGDLAGRLHGWRFNPDKQRYATDQIDQLEIGHVTLPQRRFDDREDVNVVVTDYPSHARDLAAGTREKLRAYRDLLEDRDAVADRDVKVNRIYLLPAGVPVEEVTFLDGYPWVIAWTDLVAEVPKRARVAGTRSRTTYDVWHAGNHAHQPDNRIGDVVPGAPIVWVEGSIAYESKRFPEAVIVAIKARSLNKIKRLYPQVRSVYEHHAIELEKVNKSLTDVDRFVLAVRTHGAGLWEDFVEHVHEIADPDIVKVIAASQSEPSAVVLRAEQINVPVGEDPLLEALDDRYHMLGRHHSQRVDERAEWVLYLNAKYDQVSEQAEFDALLVNATGGLSGASALDGEEEIAP